MVSFVRVAASIALAAVIPASAGATVTFEFNQHVSDTVPNSAPLVVTITELDQINGLDAVSFTVDASALISSEFVNDLFFNFDDTLTMSVYDSNGAANFSLLTEGGTCFDGADPNDDNFSAGGARGCYDAWLDFANTNGAPNGGRLNGGEVFQMTLTGEGLNEDSFSFGTYTSEYGQLYMIAKLQGLQGEQSTHMAGTILICEDDCGPPPEEVPAPGALALLGLGAFGLGLRRRRTA